MKLEIPILTPSACSYLAQFPQPECPNQCKVLPQPSSGCSQRAYVEDTALSLWICSTHSLSLMQSALSLYHPLCLSLFNPGETQGPWGGYGYNPLMDSKLVSLSVDLLTHGVSRVPALHISSSLSGFNALTSFESPNGLGITTVLNLSRLSDYCITWECVSRVTRDHISVFQVESYGRLTDQNPPIR